MASAPGAPGPGVIVVAEPAVHALVGSADATWRVQDRQPSVAALWQGLADGRLDKRSRILVFSDSQRAGEPDDETERRQVAAAIVAMANAGARVVLAENRPELRQEMDAFIAEAAQAQGVAPDAVRLLRFDPAGEPDVVLTSMAKFLQGLVVFAPLGGAAEAPHPAAPTPPGIRPSVELSDLSALGALEGDAVTGAPSTAAGATPPTSASSAGLPGRPDMPPVGSVQAGAGSIPTYQAGSLDDGSSAYPQQASMALLDRPRRPGQITITVTSSKGGSGKSTVSILLASTIATASAAAGAPLSVCLVDLDTRDGQVASLIGKFMPTALNIRVQPVWDEDRIRRNLVMAEGLGVDTLLAPIRPRTADTVGPDFYRTIVRSLQRMYDVVIMDTSVQYLEPLIADVAFKESDEILFVTTLASTAVQGMARALREMTAPADESGLGVPREKVGIIVNQSVANVGMERDQVLAAGLGVPVVGVIPLATRDVLTATNLNRMHSLLEHPLLGPAYHDLARACLPGRELASWVAPASAAAPDDAAASSVDGDADAGRRRGLFRR